MGLKSYDSVTLNFKWILTAIEVTVTDKKLCLGTGLGAVLFLLSLLIRTPSLTNKRCPFAGNNASEQTF